jgi:hypothetical protein
MPIFDSPEIISLNEGSGNMPLTGLTPDGKSLILVAKKSKRDNRSIF